MPFVPLHDQPPYYASPPSPPAQYNFIQRYASPDTDLSVPLGMSSSGNEDGGYDEAGPSRKRPRESEAAEGGDENGDRWSAHPPSHDAAAQHRRRTAIAPSMFGMSARNEFTKTVGEFVMNHAHGKEHVEIEIKLGLLLTPASVGPSHRVRIPTLCETILPPDYPIGNFSSTMTKRQNISLNALLNNVTEASHKDPSLHPIKFFRARHIDSFYNIASTPRGGGKIRVSRDREGNVVPGGVVRKKRIGDLNITSPRSAFDWRISVSTEEPTEMPSGPAAMTREKDRACYRHQLCQVDLTVVTMNNGAGAPPTISYEVEIEFLDVPALIAAAQADEDRFDEMLQSVLDTTRMLIRNV